MTKNTATTVTTASALLVFCVKYEKLSTARNAVDSLVKAERDGLDKLRKEVKDKVAKTFLTISTATEAVEIINSIAGRTALSPQADNAEYKRLSRRRTWLRGMAERRFTDYDFNEPHRLMEIRCEKVGSPEKRQAKALFAALSQAKDFGLTVEASVEDIERAIKAGRISIPVVEEKEDDSLYSAALASINSRVADLSAKTAKTASK
jgi:hypothetical protein